LKSHKPWSSFQEKAAYRGFSVPREIGPFDPLLNPELCDKPEAGKPQNFSSAESKDAREWFVKNVAVFVLNLDSDKKRWDSISGRLESLRINVTRVAGVDMRLNKSLDTAKVEGWIPRDYNFTAAQEASYSYKQQMGSIMGTLGCASGRFKAQEAVIGSGSPLAVVFEDDVWPEADFVERLLATEHWRCDSGSDDGSYDPMRPWGRDSEMSCDTQWHIIFWIILVSCVIP